MDDLVPAAPWLLAAAAVVAAGASIAAGRAEPWQARQVVLVMAAAMAISATTGGAGVIAMLLGAVLLLSAMLGTMGVRGTPDAAGCFRRALVGLLLAVCSFESAATGGVPEPVAAGGHGGHAGLSGLLAVMVVAGVIGVVVWNIIEAWIVEPVHEGRQARLIVVESWALAAGAVVLCLAS